MIDHMVRISGLTEGTVLVFEGNDVGLAMVEGSRMVNVIPSMN